MSFTLTRRRMESGREVSNADRAEWAGKAVHAFAFMTHMDTSGDLEHDKPTVIGDLIADLIHYCDQEKIDFEDVLARGRDHYKEELAEEEELKREGLISS